MPDKLFYSGKKGISQGNRGTTYPPKWPSIMLEPHLSFVVEACVLKQFSCNYFTYRIFQCLVSNHSSWRWWWWAWIHKPYGRATRGRNYFFLSTERTKESCSGWWNGEPCTDHALSGTLFFSISLILPCLFTWKSSAEGWIKGLILSMDTRGCPAMSGRLYCRKLRRPVRLAIFRKQHTRICLYRNERHLCKQKVAKEYIPN